MIKMKNPNAFPIGKKFGFFICGGDCWTRTSDLLRVKRKPILKIQYIVAIKQYNAVFIAVTLCKYYAILYYTTPVTNKLLSFFQLTHDAIIHALIDNLKAVHKLIHDSPSLIIVCGGNGS